MGEANFGGTDDDAAVGSGCERGGCTPPALGCKRCLAVIPLS